VRFFSTPLAHQRIGLRSFNAHTLFLGSLPRQCLCFFAPSRSFRDGRRSSGNGDRCGYRQHSTHSPSDSTKDTTQTSADFPESKSFGIVVSHFV
jgi:hypothetical protein